MLKKLAYKGPGFGAEIMECVQSGIIGSIACAYRMSWVKRMFALLPKFGRRQRCITETYFQHTSAKKFQIHLCPQGIVGFFDNPATFPWTVVW